jgi:hypothetical protein
MKKKIPQIKVIIEIILSTPLSLVFAKMFMLLPPVIAPEAPRDLGPVRRERTIRMIENTINTISNALIFFTRSPVAEPYPYKNYGHVFNIIQEKKEDTRISILASL